MGLGNRNARRHETQRTAGVDPSVYWDFKPGQTVMTVDGFLGTVEAVNDGPFAGSEEYQVALVNGLGGGIYTSGQLKAATDHIAKDNTASLDYPELSEVLVQRQDPGRYPDSTMGLVASVQKQADQHPDDDRPNASQFGKPTVCENGHLQWGDTCPACRNASTDDLAMVVNEGDNRPDRAAEVKSASRGGADPKVGDLTVVGSWQPGSPECEHCSSVMHTTDEHDLFSESESGDEPRTMAPEGDSFLITRCDDHGTKVTGDLQSQKHYLHATQGCHEEAHGEDARGHHFEHRADGTDCWSCCPDMHIASPGDLESGGSIRHTAGMHGVPLFSPGDLVQDFRGDGPFEVTHVRDSGHPGKSNKVTVKDPEGGSQEYYESVFTPHPSAPQEQHDRYRQRQADNKAATDLLSSIESADPNTEWAFKQHDAKTASHDPNTDPHDTSQCVSRKDNPTYCLWHKADHLETDGEPRPDVDGHGQPFDAQVNVPRCDLCNGFHDSLHHYSETEGDNGYREDESALDGIPHDGSRKQAGYLDEETEEWHDDDAEAQPFCERCGTEGHDEGDHEKTCHRCGNSALENGHHPYNGVGPDDVCPNSSEGLSIRTEKRFHGLNEDRYCNESCRAAHARDIEIGLDPDILDKSQKADQQKVCRTCQTPLMGSVGDQINGIGTPSEQHFLKTNPTGPSKYSAFDPYRLLAEASLSPSLAFHVCAAWTDVRNKAKRLRTEGRVHVTSTDNGLVVAQVKGDHGTYESVLMRFPGTQKVGQWDCGCKWATYHWGAPDDHSRFAGRMCSHALALHFEAQARGMFGREMKPDTKAPRWLKREHMERSASRAGEAFEEAPIVQHIVLTALRNGEDPDDLAMLLNTLEPALASVNSPWGEPGPNPVPHVVGPTKPRNPSENPASAGFLTAADPQGWGQQTPQDLGDRMASLDESLFEPELPSREAFAFAPLIVPLVRAVAPTVMKKIVAPMVVNKALDSLRPDKKPEEEPEGTAGDTFTQPDEDQGAQQAYADPWQKASILHDEPEPALPSTEGAEEDPDPDPHVAAIPTGVEYSMPGDIGSSYGGGLAPGNTLKGEPDDVLSPESPSVQTVGSLGDDAGVADIVAEFQRTAGASAIMAGGGGADGLDIAAAAKEHLAKTSMAVFSPAEQQELINEGESVRASNLDRLEITGTHYEALDALSSDDDDEDGWLS
jgi:hypothetical protein